MANYPLGVGIDWTGRREGDTTIVSRSIAVIGRRQRATRGPGPASRAGALLVAVVGMLALLVTGCSTVAVSPRVYFSIAAPASMGQPRVYVAAESTTPGDQPIAMTVLDPVSGRALDTFPLSTSGARPCGIPAVSPTDNSISYVAIDDRYIPFRRWEDAAGGHGEPYRVRLYFRSDQGVIWEAEVMPRYSGCPTM